tara:strand:+ start:1935 stop:2531 length:597 start_codon:yes stop_codon:yes gene_type:complete
MINFIDLKQEKPFLIIFEKYKDAIEAGQKNIEAISIASYNKLSSEVDSRYVNLKFIENDEFIFFSNYDSPKSSAFKSHNQIAVNIYWSSIDFQIRIKAKIKKTSKKYNNDYFKMRSPEKNALAISSKQSMIISSYEQVIKNYKYVKKNNDLSICPEHWGGYTFKPYEIEFWEGHDSRLNKRNLYKLDNNKWNHFILEP